MEMVVVPPPWSNLTEPGPICASLLTQHPLYGWVHKDPLDLRIGCSTLDQLGVPRSPKFHVDSGGAFEHRRRHQVFPLFAREKTVGHGREPNVGVKPDLVARMAGDHRPSTRLGHIAYKKSRPAIKSVRVVGKSLQKADQSGVTPIAVARKTHDLPVWTTNRQRHTT